MASAAIYLNPEAYNTEVPQLMGRIAAGESFLKGYIRHARTDTLRLWNVAAKPQEELEALVRKLEPTNKPISWIGRADRGGLRDPGCLYLPVPGVGQEAWSRQSTVGEHAYSITGVTHTTATQRVMDTLPQLFLSPMQPWDALICTSRAVKASVEDQLEAVWDFFEHRLQAASRPEIRLEMIPLGINTSDFTHKPEERARWRQELDIPDDAVVALFVGRLNFVSKMTPLPMAIALERAAAQTGKEIHWIVCGWAANEKVEKVYHEQTSAFCPSVKYHVLDGRKPEVRFSVWSAADFFLSLSDNIQETFGLTPVEAMAAGLPAVISDWDGYRDTVRHGQDGFRVSTYAPRPGLGNDLAFRHSLNWDSYDAYVGAVSQFTAIDLDEATRAVVNLVKDPGLRRTMGDRARQRAVEDFDWAAIIPRYEALWEDLNTRRPRHPAARPRKLQGNPWRLDPYQLFASYPTEALTAGSMIAAVPGVTVAAAMRVLNSPMLSFIKGFMASEQEFEMLLGHVARHRQARVSDIVAQFPPHRRNHMERTLLWLAKYGLVAIVPRTSSMPT